MAYEVGYDKAASDGSGVMGMLMALLATKDDRKEGKELWAVLLFIIFVVIILVVIALMWNRKDHHEPRHTGAEALAPILAASMMAKCNDNGYTHGYNYMMAHDGQRDNLKEFGEIKKELVVNRYEAAKEIADTKFEGYKATKESEEKVLIRIEEMERRQAERAEREKDAKIAHLQTMVALFYRPPAQSNYANIQQIDAGMGYAY